ncbi:hypothetical protein B0H19DRAFT_1224421 [Mycena capillaripes]|nr:hypothetical protein B0H19DRAFT_1224421 [Mycena capillaripes]
MFSLLIPEISYCRLASLVLILHMSLDMRCTTAMMLTWTASDVLRPCSAIASGTLKSDDTFDMMIGINHFEFAAIGALLELRNRKHPFEKVSSGSRALTLQDLQAIQNASSTLGKVLLGTFFEMAIDNNSYLKNATGVFVVGIRVIYPRIPEPAVATTINGVVERREIHNIVFHSNKLATFYIYIEIWISTLRHENTVMVVSVRFSLKLVETLCSSLSSVVPLSDFTCSHLWQMGGEHKSPAFTKNQPFGQIPYICGRDKDDNGCILYETRAICRYIAAKYPASGLIPAEPKATRSLSRPQRKFLGVAPDQALVDAQLEILDKKLDAYDAILAKQRCVAEDKLTVADFFHLPHAPLVGHSGCDIMTRNLTANFHEFTCGTNEPAAGGTRSSSLICRGWRTKEGWWRPLRIDLRGSIAQRIYINQIWL